MNEQLVIREATANDTQNIKALIDKYWGGEPLIVQDKDFYVDKLGGILALSNHEIIGFLIYEIQGPACEIVVFEAFAKFKGIGTKLLNMLKTIAQAKGCKKLYLTTSNDNLDALRFYQRRGFHISGIYVDSIKKARIRKPSIPITGDYGIPVRDDIELEMPLENV